jgi:hypothetical protein
MHFRKNDASDRIGDRHTLQLIAEEAIDHHVGFQGKPERITGRHRQQKLSFLGRGHLIAEK